MDEPTSPSIADIQDFCGHHRISEVSIGSGDKRLSVISLTESIVSTAYEIHSMSPNSTFVDPEWESDEVCEYSMREIQSNSPNSTFVDSDGESEECCELPMHSRRPRVLSTLSDLKRTKVVPIDMSEHEVFQLIDEEVKQWDKSDQCGGDVAKRMLVVMKGAFGGTLVVIAPKNELKKLNVSQTDGGYMTERLKNLHVSTKEFEDVFHEFTREEHDDRWPKTYHHEAARGLPKDGCTLLYPDGYRGKGGAKILNCEAQVQWEGHGTRHEAALSVANQLEQGIVMIRSSEGNICVLVAFEAGIIAHKLIGSSLGIDAL